MKQQVNQWIKMTNYSFKLYVEQQIFPKTLMAFDMGLKSTGVAITSSDMRHAFYLTTLKGDLKSKHIMEKATKLILKEKPVGLVIGKPNYVVQAKQSQNIIEVMQQWISEMALEHPKLSNMRYTQVDESWTTLDAKSQLKGIENQIKYWGHLRNQKELIDGMAAINILRRYLEFYNKK